MLVLVVLLVLVALARQSTGINLTYILKKEHEGVQPGCIAEELERYSAVGWIYPLPINESDLANSTTRFIPTINNDFNCKFKKSDRCNKIWSIKNWKIDDKSSRTFDLILDNRWEEFPTILTNRAKDFKERIEIPSVFNLGLSLRSMGGVELILSEGWNPYNYPCYHILIEPRQIFLRKYQSLPKNLATKEHPMDSYMAYSSILSADEWRNFVLRLNDKGVVSLIDANLNRTVIHFVDQQPLEPLYLLMRSNDTALWKIHQNHFMYTKSVQISRLGPTLSLTSKDLCVALYVTTCPNCIMRFIIMKDNQSRVLKEVGPVKDNKWTLVKLKDTNILSDKLNIFVETKFVDDASNKTDGFWAVDDIRVCHENEVKVTFLRLKTNITEDDETVADGISCQIVERPKWRPKKLIYSKIEDFPNINSTSSPTSLSLSWTQEDPNNQINYFISYEANDVCTSEPHNMRRVKSNGFLMTKHSEITIEDLVPHTTYNITFSSMLHEKEKKSFVTTLPSELPTPEELPNRVQILVTDNTAYVSWDQIDCSSVYGHILYAISVTNLVSNITKNVTVQSENTVEIDDLVPYTLYGLTIVTARSHDSLATKKNTVEMSINFTTKAGVAPAVQNLEIYAIDKSSVSFRYDLPKRTQGVPVYVQLMRCNPLLFKKCKSTQLPIMRCALWPRKYCIDMNNLIPYQKHTFKISVRNDLTTTFGESSQIEAYTMEQVPGTPTNITYKIVDCKEALDYCHLNVSWLHPYNQNGTITAFNIILNSTSNDTTENIQEVLKIINNTYSLQYEYQVKYIPYSTHYELYVQSANPKYRSDFAHIHVKTADIGDHIDQSPELQNITADSLTFKLPPVDRRLKSYILTVAVQDYDKSVKIPKQISNVNKVADHLCHDFGNTWLANKLEVVNSSEILTVGSGKESDRVLNANTSYCIIFVVTNKYRNSEHDVVYFKKLVTPVASKAGANQYSHLYGLLLLLLLIPLGFVIYRYLKRRRPKPKPQQTNENVYESLPFEECDDNCVSNSTYDELLHK